ncbi:Diacylglycerol kinase family enzyme [Haloechinothrix alba]|uniref:Diacylglycerol kinase family enzyme n=1 Tax=Haloechinothrix alba TaxID=664784 RepID=A0A238VBI9_9PSEU|nr:diacylglycerol kinase family protein [Haloechinothrix alba]SNR31755.1 Diacylglycerol kinase family enzyme [Haloechinothrix alba]
MRALLIVNPRATSTTPGVRDVISHALASRLTLTVAETSHRGHAAELAATAHQAGTDLVIAHGGDGTVNEIVNGMLGGEGRYTRDTDPRSAPMIAVVPGGSANVFARSLGLPPDPLETTHLLLEAIAAESTRRIGLGSANGRLFTFSAGLGWDADVVAGVDRRRGKQASPSLYTRVAARCYFRPPQGRPPLTVSIAGEDETTVRTVFVSNTDPWSYLGSRPIRLNPDCSFDTGLGVFGLRSLALPRVLGHLRRALSRKGVRRGRGLVQHANVEKLSVHADDPVNFQVDGDYVGMESTVEFASAPQALTVLV